MKDELLWTKVYCGIIHFNKLPRGFRCSITGIGDKVMEMTIGGPETPFTPFIKVYGKNLNRLKKLAIKRIKELGFKI